MDSEVRGVVIQKGSTALYKYQALLTETMVLGVLIVSGNQEP